MQEKSNTVLKMLRLIFLLCISFSLSCKKENLCDCLKSTGRITSETRSINAFENIEIQKDVSVILTQDSMYTVRIQGGENLIPLIGTEVKNNTLYIENRNTCRWVRDYEKQRIQVFVSMKYLRKINHYGTGNLSTAKPFNCDTLRLNIWDSGSMELDVKAIQLIPAINSGVGDIRLRGSADLQYVYNGGTGWIYADECITRTMYLWNKGSGNTYIQVTDFLSSKIDGTGNVYYKGKPLIIESKVGKYGKLIPQ
jgi:hypothetical protein